MATYYVRASMGGDGNTGLSPAQAWLTIDHAANTVAAGDDVYIGSGIYRELVTMDTPGTSGNIIRFIGDIAGENTGDGGPVIISAHDSNVAAPVRARCLDVNNCEFFEWHNVVFDQGSTNAVGDGNGAADLAYEEVLFQNCVMLGGPVSNDSGLTLNLNEGAVPTAAGLILDGCVFTGRVVILHDQNAAAHVDVKMTIKNCVFLQGASGSQLNIDRDAANTYSIGGIDILNCLFIGGNYGINIEGLLDDTNDCRVLGCTIAGCTGYGIYEVGGVADPHAILEDYNLFIGNANNVYGDIDSGGNSDTTIASPLLLGGIADIMFYAVMGWSPYRPWETITLGDGTTTNPALGFQSAAYAPAADMYGGVRPMMRNTDDVGPVEARARVQSDSVTVRTGTLAAVFDNGAGFSDMFRAVDASPTTISVYGQYDGNYTGNLPILEILNIPGVADQSDIMTGASGAWEQVSCTFTPSVAGYVRVRMRSQDTSVDGECYFDDLVVS